MGRFIQVTQALAGLALGGLMTGCGPWVSSSPLRPDRPVGADPLESEPALTKSALAEPTESASSLVASDQAEPAAPQTDYFREAVNRAMSAVAIGQSAQSTDDWQLAVGRWQQAVNLMGQVPSSHPNHAQAQSKVQEYRQHLAAAQQRAAGRPEPPPTAIAPPVLEPGLVAQIPIQDRRGGTPVVNVTLQGQRGSQVFPMLFDTGATGTLITAAMAQDVGAVVIGETQVKIADGSVVTLPIAYIDALEVGGLRKTSMRVAVGGSVGLLGQDVYGQYGIALGSHVINLHR